jgi:hypothetical protein
MAKYVIAPTRSGATGFRPWQSRLIGDYQKAVFYVPTESYPDMPAPGEVTGGLGLDLSAVPPWAWLLGAGAAWYFFFGPGRKRA